MTGQLVASIEPITRPGAEQLAKTEYQRLADQLRTLSDSDWAKPTDCPDWDVRAVAGHCAGMMADFTSARSMMRRMLSATRAAKKADIPMVDAMTAMQVADYAPLSTDDLIAHVERTGPRAARWRARVPRPFRAMPMEESVGGVSETWRLGFLLDTILTRDPWMHRVDIAHATGRDLELTPEHDGRIVADVVAEWARRHGQPFTLALTGPAGGEFVGGDEEGARYELDAVQFCRTLSGRLPGNGLLTQEVPF